MTRSSPDHAGVPSGGARALLGALVAGMFAVAGCSSDQSVTGSSSSASSASSGSSRSASSSSPAASSSSPSTSSASGGSPTVSGSTSATPVKPAGPAVPPQTAARIAASVLTAAAQSQSGNGTAAADARDQAFTSTALRAAVADARLASVAPQLRLGPPAITGSRPGILAVSRGPANPRVILAQTRPGGSLYPVLYLLSASRGAAYRIVSSAVLLPSARIGAFAPVQQGAQLLPGGGQLSTGVGTLLGAYAKGLSWPPAKAKKGQPAPYRPGDRFASQLRLNAAAQAAAVKVQASFTQRHRQLPGSTTTLAQAAGGALVFTTFERTDAFAVKPTQKLLPPAKLRAFQPKLKAVTKAARLTTLEFLVFQVPARGSTDGARLVAASEHLVSGSGS